jgi:bifunctional N-acetylglucosamine-1-phosphate-uridyltransferase/glucosamine-1-phosphate-acetyltransferase GlmU-like protein
LGLQMISIRLSKSTIDTYKALAKMHGVGYQPMMRDVLERWVVGEMKQMLVAGHEKTRVKEKVETELPPENPLRKAA